MASIKVGVWNPYTKKCTIETIAKRGTAGLHDMYKLIDCKAVDARSVDKRMTVYFDDEFLLRQEQILAEKGTLAITRLPSMQGEIGLWGTLLFIDREVKDGEYHDIDLTWERFDPIIDEMETKYPTEAVVVPPPIIIPLGRD